MSNRHARVHAHTHSESGQRASVRDGQTMADSGSEDIAVIGNTDLTPSESENNLKNTVKPTAEPFNAMWPIICAVL